MSQKNRTLAAASSSAYVRRPENPRQLTSEDIESHLAAFEAAGGTVEVLSTTAVLKRIQPDATGQATTTGKATT